jgi:hypothetical protein
MLELAERKGQKQFLNQCVQQWWLRAGRTSLPELRQRLAEQMLM